MPKHIERTVTKTPRKTSHGFHLLMTLLTLGLWLPVWALSAMNAARRKRVVSKTVTNAPLPVTPVQPPANVYVTQDGRRFAVDPAGRSHWVEVPQQAKRLEDVPGSLPWVREEARKRLHRS